MRRALVALLLLAAGAGEARADGATVVTLSSGSGMSLGRAGEGVGRRRSPAFIELDVGLSLFDDASIEWTPSILVELEGRVSVAAVPSVKKIAWLKPWLALYAGGGVPFFFAPFTMIGVEGAVGGIVRVGRRFGVVLEIRVDVFFAGSDLEDGQALAKLDLALGIRFDL
ncbi:MAG: hypothetical protein KC503_29330 [Myxococcales bacterium]|nr:hypothetical protein [Myxococcales bacterium]